MPAICVFSISVLSGKNFPTSPTMSDPSCSAPVIGSMAIGNHLCFLEDLEQPMHPAMAEAREIRTLGVSQRPLCHELLGILMSVLRDQLFRVLALVDGAVECAYGEIPGHRLAPGPIPVVPAVERLCLV